MVSDNAQAPQGSAKTQRKGNCGEWSEPYAAVRMIGDGKLFVADRNGKKDPNSWMTLMELIREETQQRMVKYSLDASTTDVQITVNGNLVQIVPVSEFDRVADKLLKEIQDHAKAASKGAFSVDVDLDNDLTLLMIGSIKAKSSKKDDVVLSVTDPRSGVVRKSVGFSIKSELGRKPSLFNTGRASAAEFELPGMTPAFMAHINSIFTSKNSVAVTDRCKAMLAAGVKMKYRGFAEAPKAKARTFYENLLLINPLLPEVLAWILLGLYTERFPSRDVKTIVQELVAKNPLGISRPEVRYPYMIKQFLYAAYCGMTAGQFWDGQSEVNGGFICVNSNGEVLAYYALESDSFKEHLFRSCLFEQPSTGEGHGNFGSVIFEESGTFVFKLNFSIRYGNVV